MRTQYERTFHTANVANYISVGAISSDPLEFDQLLSDVLWKDEETEHENKDFIARVVIDVLKLIASDTDIDGEFSGAGVQPQSGTDVRLQSDAFNRILSSQKK